MTVIFPPSVRIACKVLSTTSICMVSGLKNGLSSLHVMIIAIPRVSNPGRPARPIICNTVDLGNLYGH